jgi:hypothetical protein
VIAALSSLILTVTGVEELSTEARSALTVSLTVSLPLLKAVALKFPSLHFVKQQNRLSLKDQ